MDKKVVLTNCGLNDLNSRRKRSINLGNVKSAVRKKCRNSGQPYISTAGNPIPGKLPSEGKACGETCQKRGCLLERDIKKGIFTQYYEHGSLDMQTTFLLSCITRSAPNYRNNEENNRRQNTYTYFLFYAGERYEVCQKTLMDTLKITEKRIRIVQQKLLQGAVVGNDQRGVHSNRTNRLDEYTLDIIKTHIRSFPTTLSHYKRNTGDPLREYLPPGLNCSIMFRLFIKSNQENIRAPFLKDAYSRELSKSGLMFAKLRSDTCSQCEKLYIAEKSATTDNGRRAARAATEAHHEHANMGYTNMKSDINAAKANPALIVLCVDLQQVLFCPTLFHKEMFYLRQYSSYNYCIYNARTEDASMCFWTESMATRGSEELVSCLWKYITENFEPLAENEQKSLIIWSDRCTGQNNNYLTLAFGKLLIQRKYFTSFEQKFLSTGHSFLVCDRLFGLIEKQKKICKVFIPEEWANVFNQARPSQPFRTVMMAREDFLEFDDLLQIVPRPNTLKVTQALSFRMVSEDISGIFSKENHSEETVIVRHQIPQPYLSGTRYSRREAWTEEWLENVTFGVRNPHDILVDAKKYADLLKMLDFLEPQYESFYRNLPHHPSSSST